MRLGMGCQECTSRERQFLAGSSHSAASLARVKAALMRRGRTEHEAEDLLQDAWVRLACYAREQPVDKPEAFLIRAVMNLSIDAYRSRLAHGTDVLLDDVVLVNMSPPPRRCCSPANASPASASAWRV